MKHEKQMGSGTVIYTSRAIKIGSGIQHFINGSVTETESMLIT
jgi:hypothetical protein